MVASLLVVRTSVEVGNIWRSAYLIYVCKVGNVKMITDFNKAKVHIHADTVKWLL